MHRLWSRHGFDQACLDALEAVPDSQRADAARELLGGSGSGLSNPALDRLLGVDVDGVLEATRARIASDPSLKGKWCWQDADADAIPQTRYEDLVALAQSLPSGHHIVDLGSGFGRLGLVIGLARPDVHFTGLEVVSERVAEAKRVTEALGLDANATHEEADLDHHPVPIADAYFLFFSFPEATATHVLRQLEDIAHRRPISIIVHGMWPGRELDEVSWLRAAPAPEPFRCFTSANTNALRRPPR